MRNVAIVVRCLLSPALVVMVSVALVWSLSIVHIAKKLCGKSEQLALFPQLF